MVDSVSRPAGLQDKLPRLAYAEREIVARLQHCLESYGYRVVETPVLEYTELYQRKSGEEWVGRLFSFEHRSRMLCLRPEFTASIGRLYVDQLQALPKPMRLQTAGPVFRRESHGRARSRQFTMVGAEMIGGEGPLADAEAITMAWEGLTNLGLGGCRLVIGHVGILSQFLERLGLESRARRFVLDHMENLRKPDRGKEYVKERLHRAYPEPSELAHALRSRLEASSGGQGQALSEDQIRLMLDLVYSSADIEDTQGRSREEIATRLLRKLRGADERERTLRALDFAAELGNVQCEPEEALRRTKTLLEAYEFDDSTLAGLRAVVEALGWAGIPEDQVVLDMGLGRGLHYYTGIVFEIHSQEPSADSQLCGGGRYDELLRILGANQDVPAVGFAYGVERVRMELLRQQGEETLAPHEPHTDVLVIPVTEAETRYALEVAGRLRCEVGAIVETDLKPAGSLASRLSYADRLGVPLAVLIGAEEANARTATIRRMRDGEQHTVALDRIGEEDLLRPCGQRRATCACHNMPEGGL